ncbi:MAG: tRNA (adenosine(37)-N6)-threonylcarbamoyltransferase complex ATPase subunit type 1 TsaE [Actinobacteria bacterium]|nr:MAG: tRNA (adenosine(37)-N6)-threonylcarbamoyltransferase complex ATPase subunit type 1 TsaE [Actinomycetota bacterium]
MIPRSIETSGPTETEALGAKLAAGLREGDVVLVQGELGSGKTTLVRGAARALGVADAITSPTFSIGHRGGLEDEDPALLDDYLGPGRIAFVEWPREEGAALPRARLRVTLTHRGGDRRGVEVGGGAEDPER